MMEVEFLLNEKPGIITAIDCALAAFTFNELGDFEKTEHYWKEAIARSPMDEMRHVHTRDYASFLFQQNKEEAGRTAFREALAIRLKKTDDHLMVVIETYLLWASAEFFFGYDKEFRQRIDAAKEICLQLKNKNKCLQMTARVEASSKMLA